MIALYSDRLINFGYCKKMKKTAILIGATGLTGSILLEYLLNDSNYDTIKLFSRRKIGIDSPKIKEYTIDLFELKKNQSDFTGDVVFCCIGTTKVKTPDKDIYRKIDLGIPVDAAELAKTNGIETFLVISALGSNSKSSVFYNRVKGEMEEMVLSKGIPNTYILKPSLIIGNRNEKRFGEGLAAGIMKVFNFLIPKKYKAIPAEAIAKSMVEIAEKGYGKSEIPSEEIKAIAEN